MNEVSCELTVAWMSLWMRIAIQGSDSSRQNSGSPPSSSCHGIWFQPSCTGILDFIQDRKSVV